MYLDADTLVRRNFEELFTLPFNFAAVPDVFKNGIGWLIGFNSGVMFIQTSSQTMDNMINVLPMADFPKGYADQGFFNLYFAHQTARLPYIYNANLAIKQRKPEVWNAILDDIRIVHYTVRKPFPLKWEMGEAELQRFFEEKKQLDGGIWNHEVEWWRETYVRMKKSLEGSSQCL